MTTLQKTTGIPKRYVVKRPSSAKDLVRIYRLKKREVKEAKKLAKTLFATA
jgi:hypothetical protein